MVGRIAVGQGGGPTSVINDSLAGIIYEAQLKGIEVVGLRNGVEGGGLHPNVPGNLVDLSNANPYWLRGIPGSYLGTTRMKLDPQKNHKEIEQLKENLEELDVDALLYIGGNDTSKTLQGVGNGIHIQKTVDNDLPENDHTSGWGSACLANSEIIRKLTPDIGGFNPRIDNGVTESFSTAPVVVYQTQGRDTGWLTLGCAFAKVNHAGDIIKGASPHLFLPREVPYDEALLLDRVDNLLKQQGRAFIVCSEELVDRDGITLADKYGASEDKDPFGHVEHGRAGSFNYASHIAMAIKRGLKINVAIEGYDGIKETPFSTQHIPRSLERSLVDAQEAFESGREAVRAFIDGDLNKSIALKREGQGYNIVPRRIPLEAVAGKVRRVDSKYLGTIDGPTQEFYDDFLPLVGGPLGMTHFEGPALTPYIKK